MKMGTKSLLYGAHTWWIHPWFVAIAWWKLYGFPIDPRLWVMFMVHDWGYWGKPNMDGPEGEDHVRTGANIMHWLFDPNPLTDEDMYWEEITDHFDKWGYEALLHSRYYAKKNKMRPSRLCYADKLAIILMPKWMYIPLVWLTGEWIEYRDAHSHETMIGPQCGIVAWYDEMRAYVGDWLYHNKFGQEDTWTKTKPTASSVS